MLALAESYSTAAHWSEEQYLGLFGSGSGKPERLVLVAESSLTASPEEAISSVVGFLVARCVAHEWELENIVVVPGARRRGIGRQLLEALLTAARKTNAPSVFFEVRESNVEARSLYEKLGFRQTGRRPAYYRNPSEDAILYRGDL